MAAPSHNIFSEFLASIDILTERLRPQKRPQDSRAADCSVAEQRVLSALGLHEPRTMSELAAFLDAPLSTVTRTVDNLVAKRLVERRRVKGDRRIVEVGFSARGKKINQYVVESRLALAEGVLKRLPSAKRKALIEGLALVAGDETKPSA